METRTEGTKWLDEIYDEVFDCSMYPKTQVRCEIIKFKII